MSLLLTGAKTAVIAGTEMAIIEIYTQEAYTIPFAFTDNQGNPIDCTVPTLWTVTPTAKWYTCDVTYSEPDLISPANTTVIIENILEVDPQPSQPANLVANFTNASIGTGYLYIPSDMSGQTANTTVTLNQTNSLLAIVTLEVLREDVVSGYDDISREPIGLIIRYQ
jgi:hypothetical protein